MINRWLNFRFKKEESLIPDHSSSFKFATHGSIEGLSSTVDCSMNYQSR